jgi:hypothetical protein
VFHKVALQPDLYLRALWDALLVGGEGEVVV